MTIQVELDDDRPKFNRGAGLSDMTDAEFAQVTEFCKRSGEQANVTGRNAIYIHGGLYTLDEIIKLLQGMEAAEDRRDKQSTYNE